MKITGRQNLLKWLRIGHSTEIYTKLFTGKNAEWADMPHTVILRGKNHPVCVYQSEQVLEYLEKKYGSDEFDIWGLFELAGKHRPF